MLLLHGFTGCAESMEGIAGALQPGRRVIRPDFLGHGQSDAPRDPSLYAMGHTVARMQDVLDQLEIETCDVIGYSMGGRVALSLAVAFPSRIRSLTLIGATPGLPSEEERTTRRRADDQLAQRLIDEGLESFVDDWMALPLFASQARLGSAFLVRAREQRLQGQIEGWAGSLRGLGTGVMPPLYEALPSLQQAVLLVVGQEDPKFTKIAEQMLQRLPHAECVLVPRAGHAAHLEQPEDFAAILDEFLDRVSPRDGWQASP